MKLSLKIIGMCAFLFWIPLFAHGQISNFSESTTDSISLATNPQFPKPNQEVTISVDGYSTNLDAATITWFLNGSPIEKGVGKKDFTITSGKMGTISNVSIIINPQIGAPVKKSITISPSNITFFWQSNTYAPPFYEGKALFTKQSDITVVAVPEFNNGQGTIDPSALIYEWTLNDYVLDSKSGYGKQSLTLTGNYFGRPEILSVKVTSSDGSISSNKKIVLTPKDPLVLIYENNPLLGILTNHAVTGDFNLQKNSTEVSFFAAPYFFRPDLLSSKETSYAWEMNGNSIPESNGNTITFRNDTGTAGRSSVSLDALQKNTLSGSGSANFSIIFQ